MTDYYYCMRYIFSIYLSNIYVEVKNTNYADKVSIMYNTGSIVPTYAISIRDQFHFLYGHLQGL